MMTIAAQAGAIDQSTAAMAQQGANPPTLATTNLLLGIMAAVSLLEALAVVGVFLGAFLLYRRVMRVIAGIEARQVAPAAARVNAILDDIKDVTSTVKEGAAHAEWMVSRILSSLRRWRG